MPKAKAHLAQSVISSSGLESGGSVVRKALVILALGFVGCTSLLGPTPYPGPTKAAETPTVKPAPLTMTVNWVEEIHLYNILATLKPLEVDAAVYGGPDGSLHLAIHCEPQLCEALALLFSRKYVVIEEGGSLPKEWERLFPGEGNEQQSENPRLLDSIVLRDHNIWLTRPCYWFEFDGPLSIQMHTTVVEEPISIETVIERLPDSFSPGWIIHKPMVASGLVAGWYHDTWDWRHDGVYRVLLRLKKDGMTETENHSFFFVQDWPHEETPEVPDWVREVCRWEK